MLYNYQAYGIPIISDIEIPALLLLDDTAPKNPIRIELAAVPKALKAPPSVEKPFSTFNPTEFLYQLPQIASYYITEGNHILVEPKSDNWDAILLYLYTNGLAAILFQRNQFPFHVSGVYINDDEVILLAAPSRTGKSTTALNLKAKGYPTFTDDTALIWVDKGICYAQASYPVTRLWQDAIEQQTVYAVSDKRNLLPNMDKFGFDFHQDFDNKPKRVKAIVFLEKEGESIKIKQLKPLIAFKSLADTIYRSQWVDGMQKQLIHYQLITTVSNAIPFFLATRPKNKPTFDTFSEAIEQQIINGL